MAKLEALPQLVAEGVVEAMKELANKEQSEAPAEDEEEDKVEKSSKLNKSSSKLDEMTPHNKKVEPEHKFLGGEKRDELGRVRKYL